MRISISLFIILLSVFSSCVSKKTVTSRYYVIETPTENIKKIPEDTASIIAHYCQIEEVLILPAYATRKIANRSRSNEITYYSYHEWAVRPEEYFLQIMLDFFEQQNTFSGVALRYWEVDPKYKLITTVYQLEVVQRKSKLAAHLHIESKLVDNSDMKTILSHRADKEIIVEKKDLNYIAKAFSEMYYEFLKEFNEVVIDKMKQ